MVHLLYEKFFHWFDGIVCAKAIMHDVLVHLRLLLLPMVLLLLLLVPLRVRQCLRV